MSYQAGDRLYNLLPAVYRVRDSAQGEPLRALLAIISNEFGVIEADIAGLLENWFIETCDEWVVPYIGDLLGTRGLRPVGGRFTARRYVAHTLRYRRQKGTAAMLEQLARDVTLWPARVVEFFQVLDCTQHLNHLRPQNTFTPDLRDTNGLELLGGPFEQANHTVDLRAVADNRGKYNVPNIGIYLWRLESYPLAQSTARLAGPVSDGRYWFNALGLDVPLFNQPEPADENSRVADEKQVPGGLRRRALYEDLEATRRGEESAYFAKPPVLVISSANQIVPAKQIVVCDLSDWSRPPDKNSAEQPIHVAVDPVLGRIAFAANSIPGDSKTVLVSYSYGFSGELGGGPYDRNPSLRKILAKFDSIDTKDARQVAVSQDLTADNETIFSSLSDAIASPSTGWNAQQPGTKSIIAILDSRSYEEDIPTILVPEGSHLVILAADWPELRKGNPLDKTLAPVKIRPHLRGNLTVSSAVGAGGTAGSLTINGMLIEGTVSVKPGHLGRLAVVHCTLLPAGSSVKTDDPSLITAVDNPELEVSLEQTICGALSLGNATKLTTVDSIVDAATGIAISALDADACIQTTTVLGAVGTSKSSGVGTLYSANSIFTGPLFVERRQTGCLRFCSLASDSRTPRRYRCQTGLTPVFTSTMYGQPGYAQLSPACPSEIRTGAEDGSEMGAFDFIKQPQREDNLRASLKEYLRFGLEAGIFFVT